jgi:hypothetical protein
MFYIAIFGSYVLLYVFFRQIVRNFADNFSYTAETTLALQEVDDFIKDLCEKNNLPHSHQNLQIITTRAIWLARFYVAISTLFKLPFIISIVYYYSLEYLIPTYMDLYLIKIYTVGCIFYLLLYTYSTQQPRVLYFMVRVVGWLSINYDSEFEHQTLEFLEIFTNKYYFLVKSTKAENMFVPHIIIDIVKKVLSSHNNNYHWLKSFDLLVMNIVNDAVRHSRISRRGIENYLNGTEKYMKQQGTYTNNRIIVDNVIEYYNKNLAQIPSEMRTFGGWMYAHILDFQAVRLINHLNKLF